MLSSSLLGADKTTRWNKALTHKLKSIKIGKIDFEEAKPLAVFKYLRIRSKALDPEGKGVNFVFKHLSKNKTLISLQMENVPLYSVIKYACMAANLEFKVEEYAVIIQPKRAKKTKSTKKR
jgi:hypothetical protein